MKKEDYQFLHAGGSLVMGQDQDGKHGSIFNPFFDKQQSFCGLLTQVELWNTTLTASEIQKTVEVILACPNVHRAAQSSAGDFENSRNRRLRCQL